MRVVCTPAWQVDIDMTEKEQADCEEQWEEFEAGRVYTGQSDPRWGDALVWLFSWRAM